MKVTIRPWEISDAVFICYVRNDSQLMRWFRQSEHIELKEQLTFIEQDLKFREYNGMVIEADSKPVGFCAVKWSGEFSIGILPEWQKKGVATKAMKLLLKRNPQVWSEVFVDNPALSWYLHKLGFKATAVKERAYYKPGIGMIDTVTIKYD